MVPEEKLTIGAEQVTLTIATEEDLPAIVRLQFDAMEHLQIYEFLTGYNTKYYHEVLVEKYKQTMRVNSGLAIVKAELTDEAQRLNGLSDADTKIVGFCMFYLPNTDAESEVEKIPTVIRPPSGPIQAPFFKDPTHRQIAEKIMSTLSDQRQRDIAGRTCAYVSNMSVRPGFQKRGIGCKMMQWGCQRFDDAGCDAYLGASNAGIGMYLRFNFEEIGELRVGKMSEDFLGAAFPSMWRTTRKR